MTTAQDHTVTEEVASASRRPSRPVVVTFVVATALSLAMGAVWAVSTPLFASPDEPSHAIRAVATWTGDPSGEVSETNGIRTKEYRVPSPYDQSQAIAGCSAFDANKTADCGPPFDPNGQTLTAMSTAGFYPPLFYWAVGWGGALIDGSTGLYLMRLIHVALCRGADRVGGGVHRATGRARPAAGRRRAGCDPDGDVPRGNRELVRAGDRGIHRPVGLAPGPARRGGTGWLPTLARRHHRSGLGPGTRVHPHVLTWIRRSDLPRSPSQPPPARTSATSGAAGTPWRRSASWRWPPWWRRCSSSGPASSTPPPPAVPRSRLERPRCRSGSASRSWPFAR